jgi:argininosuccinate lyase
MAEEMRRFSSSFAVDVRLARYDVIGSKAHAAALLSAGVLDQGQHDELIAALDQVEQEILEGSFGQTGSGPLPEDVHSAVESRLVELCGETGQRLHAGRSRNDQVVTDMLLWLKDTTVALENDLRGVQQALVTLAEEHQNLVVPNYTHLQRAQSISMAHQLLAHFEGLERDVGRLRDARTRADRCPLGAGAGAGTTLPIDRAATASRLGFAGVALNSVDAVGDRDWAVEFVAACAMTMTHLSRLAEELIVWSTEEFGVARIGDAFCTGSSMMPQKRNPDAVELIRGKTARVAGDLQTLLALLKGLPLGYQRDLQEDKEAVFDAADTTGAALRIMAGVLAETEFFRPTSQAPDFTGATDLAEHLVLLGVPFRQAHRRVGELVRACEATGRGLAQATSVELTAAGAPGIDPAALSQEGGVSAKKSSGSPAPGEMAKALARCHSLLSAPTETLS